MSSRDVPTGGLMEGEPGTLWLNDGKGEPEDKPETLNAELYIDEEQFDLIFQAIRDGAQKIEAVHLGIIAELFESEVDASLSDWWMSHEYGMLKKKDWSQTRARLDNIRAAFGGKLLIAPTDRMKSTNRSMILMVRRISRKDPRRLILLPMSSKRMPSSSA